jgi:hypothetical protein
MNRSGHLTLVKSTLTAMPIYLMMCDVLRRNFIWTGKDSHQRQKHSGLAHCLPSDNMGRAGRLGGAGPGIGRFCFENQVDLAAKNRRGRSMVVSCVRSLMPQ